MEAISLKILEMKNKSRQGAYVRITQGKKRGYYKFIDGILLDAYIEAFKRKGEYSSWKKALREQNVAVFSREKQDLEQRKRQRKYNLSKIKSIENYIKTGIINRNYDSNFLPGNERAIMEDILSNVVLEKGLRQKVIDNDSYTRRNLWYKIDISGIDEDGNKVAIGNLRIRDLSVSEISNIIEYELPAEFDYHTIDNLVKKFNCAGDNYLTNKIAGQKVKVTQKVVSISYISRRVKKKL